MKCELPNHHCVFYAYVHTFCCMNERTSVLVSTCLMLGCTVNGVVSA